MRAPYTVLAVVLGLMVGGCGPGPRDDASGDDDSTGDDDTTDTPADDDDDIGGGCECESNVARTTPAAALTILGLAVLVAVRRRLSGEG